MWPSPHEGQRGRGPNGQMARLLRAHSLAELRKIASGSARQRLWLEGRKMGYQVSYEDRNRLLGRGTVGEVRRRERLGRRATDRTKEIVHSFRG